MKECWEAFFYSVHKKRTKVCVFFQQPSESGRGDSIDDEGRVAMKIVQHVLQGPHNQTRAQTQPRPQAFKFVPRLSACIHSSPVFVRPHLHGARRTCDRVCLDNTTIKKKQFTRWSERKVPRFHNTILPALSARKHTCQACVEVLRKVVLLQRTPRVYCSADKPSDSKEGLGLIKSIVKKKKNN